MNDKKLLEILEGGIPKGQAGIRKLANEIREYIIASLKNKAKKKGEA